MLNSTLAKKLFIRGCDDSKDSSRTQTCQRQREAERRARLGGRVLRLEIYQGTADALDRLCMAGGFAEPAELITQLIHSADNLQKRDVSRFNELAI